jgi:F-type H+-transporting ATPase subunit b
MKILASLTLAIALTAMTPAVFAQEHGHEAAPAHEAAAAHEGGASHESEGGHANMEGWKWANFLVLAGLIGYFVGKNAGPFFAARSQKIRQEMVTAAEKGKDAEARAAAVERRLQNLESEIAVLRNESQQQAQAEAERLAQATSAEIAKIQANAEQEIASAGKAARMDLRSYSAQLAVRLAEQRVRARMTPGIQEELVQGFVEDLHGPSSKASA